MSAGRAAEEGMERGLDWHQGRSEPVWIPRAVIAVHESIKVAALVNARTI